MLRLHVGLEQGIPAKCLSALRAVPVATATGRPLQQRQQGRAGSSVGGQTGAELAPVRVGRTGDGRAVVAGQMLLKVAGMLECSAALATDVNFARVPVIHTISCTH